jgi:hypothetical protein
MNKLFFGFFWISIITATFLAFAEGSSSALDDIEQENKQYEEQWQTIVLREIDLNENEVVQYQDNDKIYLVPHRLVATEAGIYLNTHGKDLLYLPCVRSDSKGCYIKKFADTIGYWDPPKGLNPNEMKKKEQDRIKQNKEEYERNKENTKKEAEWRKKQQEENRKRK